MEMGLDAIAVDAIEGQRHLDDRDPPFEGERLGQRLGHGSRHDLARPSRSTGCGHQGERGIDRAGGEAIEGHAGHLERRRADPPL